MISFDYLRSARPDLLVRIMEFRIPSRLQSGVAAVIVATAFVGGAWGIESCRLAAALNVEAEYRQNFERSRADVARADVYFDRVKNLVALDKRLRDVVLSGNVTARRLAQIGNALPSTVWLSSISHDGQGLSIEGTAPDMATVGRVLSDLNEIRGVRDPKLLDASAEADPKSAREVKFTVRAEGALP